MDLVSAMKELTISTTEGKVTQSLDSVSIPTPKANEVVIKVAVVGLNPKDWKFAGDRSNQGDDIAGYIHSVGEDVRNFKPGDRVCAYHDMLEKNGGYAQYAIAEEGFTFHLPEKVSFEGMFFSCSTLYNTYSKSEGSCIANAMTMNMQRRQLFPSQPSQPP